MGASSTCLVDLNPRGWTGDEKVRGLGFMFSGLGFRVQGLGFGVVLNF